MPPSGMNESCIELTEPFDADVVADGPQRRVGDAEAQLPCLPCCRRHCVALATWSAPSCVSTGLPALRAHTWRSAAATKIDVIAASSAQPCRVSPTISRTCSKAPPGISRIASNSRKLDSGVGFSNGCAELTLKKPPPLVPSCLIAICEAAGPSGIVCSVAVAFSVTGLPFLVLQRLPIRAVLGIVVSHWLDQRHGRVLVEGLYDALAHQHDAPGSATAAAGCRASCARDRPRNCRWR